MGINDYGGTGDALNSPPLGGPGGWAEAVAAVVDGDDTTVDARIAAHSADSTDVHGIPDTADLATTAELEEYAAARATVGNLLTDNQASGTAPSSTGGCTQVDNIFTATGSGSFTAAHSISDSLVLVAGKTLTLHSRGTTTGTRTSRAQLSFRRADNSTVANFDGDTVSGSNVVSTVTAEVPSGATYVLVYFLGCFTAGAAGDTITMHEVGLWQGAGGNWAMPGTPITGLGTRITRPNIDDRLVEQWNGSAWSVVDYDSGWRDISGLLSNGWTGTLYIRRAGGAWVDMWGTLDSTNKTGNSFITMPVGFRATPGRALLGASRNNVWTLLPIYAGSTDLNIMTNPTEATLRVTAAYATFADALPTSLPGTLVTPAPE